MSGKNRVFLLAVLTLAVFCGGVGCKRKAKKTEAAAQAGNSAAQAGNPAAQAGKSEVKVPEGMVWIPGGEFVMGGKAKDVKDAEPHNVIVSPFLMDKHEVTQAKFRDVVGENPSKFKGDDLPVERVRWNDCLRYCNMRSEKEGLTPCYDLETGKCDFTADGYRLPTEAEWEFACRAGSTGDLYNQGGIRKIGDVAWFRKNSKETTHKVGSKQPNAFGLYDMYGNVAEWCNDFYDANYYASSPAQDPKGPETGTKRVLRGGSWQDRDKKISSFMRMSDDPATADICQGYETYGFRCVRRIPAGK